MDGVTVRAFGGFDVVVGGRCATPSAPKPRQILAVLSLRCGETVGVDRLVDELWGSRPPRRALGALQTHVYELRKDLESAQARTLLLTRPNGYAVDLAPDRLDVTRFDRWVGEGAAALGRGDPSSARHILGQALSMSAGQPLATVHCGEYLAGQVVRLQEARVRAMELRVEADLRLGRDDEVIGELRVAVADHPFHEGFVHQLMTALHRRGRRPEALAAYKALSRRLADELSVVPGDRLQQVYQSITGAGVVHVEGRPATARRAVSARLPRDVDDFTGREDLVRRARAHLLTGSREGTSPVVTMAGMAGVGKTATAIHLGHAVRDAFPDGQVFVHRTAGDPAGLAECIARAGGLPLERDTVSAVRSWCADRRLLLVLDDVTVDDRVHELLPGESRCAIIATYRSPADVPGAHGVALEPMDTGDGLAFLSCLLSPQRVDAEPAAAKGIVEAVGGLPFALRELSRRLTGRLDVFLTGLSDALDRLPLSQVSALGTVYDRLFASYCSLRESDRRFFRLLSLLHSNDFTTEDAGRAFLLDPVGAEMALVRLADAHVVRQLGDGRYAMHTLLRRLALERLIAANSRTDQ